MIRFGREITSRLEAALQREWLVTNGIGGFATSTIAMANTRRQHGLLIAALEPPSGRTMLVSKLEVTARLGGELFPLTTNEYVDGTINPHGYLNLESFALEGSIPVFTWAVADNRLEQRVWMAHGHNTTFVTYTLVHARHPIALELIPLCTYRAANALTDSRGWAPTARADRGGLRVDASPGAAYYWLLPNRGIVVPGVVRHWALRHRSDSYRGLGDSEDLYAVGRLDTKLGEGETLALVLTAEAEDETDWEAALDAERARQEALVELSGLGDEPDWVRQLVLAADQFIVDRPFELEPGAEEGKTILDGYPWSEDTGRDTLIALPGLVLATGQADVAALILRTLARFVDRGLLSNRLPASSHSQASTYVTADATLWLFYALYFYGAKTGDRTLIEQLYPVLVDIVEWHQRGTTFGLGVDTADGLLRTGEAPYALTWMDAQDGNRIVTPRVGKPVEINALWYNALCALASFGDLLGKTEEAARWSDRAAHVAASFEARFWYPEGGYLYDVVDGPEGDDASLRPNQILAVSLPFSPLRDREKARAVVDVVARQLYTSYGLRTLAPAESAYARRYGGNQAARASVAHQGTVWSWLIGPFVAAHLRVYGDVAKARALVRPFGDHLGNHGIGTVSELFDADPPHTARGSIASAWGVAQVLCSWISCSERQAGEA